MPNNNRNQILESAPALANIASRGGDLFEALGQSRAAADVSSASITVDRPSQFNLDDFAGFTFRGNPVLDLDGVRGQIDSGNRVSVPNGTITYTFLQLNHLTGLFNNPTLGFTAGNGASPFSAAQEAAARGSIQLWDDLIAPTFVESRGQGADIVFANSLDPAQAYAYYPDDAHGYRFTNDVFVADPAANWTNNWFGFNGYGATTLTHELGHTLGLSHPGAYNYDPNLDLTYDNYAEYAQDSEQYTIMSYWGASETGARVVNWNEFLFSNAQTPMLHDILTIQAMYGADPTTRAGNTTYGFNSNAGNVLYDFSQNAYPFLAIYDAGGSDTIDLSGFTASAMLDLHAGSFSSVGQGAPTAAAANAARQHLSDISGQVFAPLTQAQITSTVNSFRTANANSIAADTGVSGVFATEYMNMSIAYGTIIENAVGTSARDVIWGNEVANVIRGMGGNDVIDGFEGRDVLFGGTGADVFQFHVLELGDRIDDFEGGVDKIDLRGTGVDFTFVGSAAFSHTAGELRYAGGMLEGDVNGDGVADISIVVAGSQVIATDLLIL